jgi:hypothetical protein
MQIDSYMHNRGSTNGKISVRKSHFQACFDFAKQRALSYELNNINLSMYCGICGT